MRLNARLRGRNPVVMSMATSLQMMIPHSQRNQSLGSYAKKGTQQQSADAFKTQTQYPRQRMVSLEAIDKAAGLRDRRGNNHKSINSGSLHAKTPVNISHANYGKADHSRNHLAQSNDKPQFYQRSERNQLPPSNFSSRTEQRQLPISSHSMEPSHDSGLVLNRKFRRNARERSYEANNHAVQLPPMTVKPVSDN